jgi:hypothetical protein
MRRSWMGRSFMLGVLFALAASMLLTGCDSGVCGDGVCGAGEHPWDCPEDCFCGDGVCRGEDCCSCPEDCHYGDPAMPCLGNEYCDVACGETFVNAPEDCDREAISPDTCAYNDTCRCGDGNCDVFVGENCDTCPGDCEYCGSCGDGMCSEAWGEDGFTCPEDCGALCGDGDCNPYLGENCLTCAADCGDCSSCGNGVCDVGFDGGETCSLCPEDCHLGDPAHPCCGNGLCEPDENADVCPCDCDTAPCSSEPSDTCGNSVLEPGEECDVESDCYARYYGRHTEFQYRAVCSDCMCAIPCDHDGVCEPDDWENCRICPDDCNYGDPDAPCCGDGFCTLVMGEDFTNCSADCPPTIGPSLPLMSAWSPMWLDPPAYCGNGIVEVGEECESDADCTAPNAICTALCYCAVQCQEGDPCFNMGPGYPCTTPDGEAGGCEWNNCDCVVEPPAVCGNGVTETGEECETDVECPTAYYCRPGECWCDHIECGDGVCSTALENTDLCPEDCACVDNGECEPGEGAGCADCGALESACGVPCESADDCREGLSCFNGHCWDNCVCEGQCGPETGPGEPDECHSCQSGSECHDYCSSPDAWCEGGCCRCP